MAGTRIASVSGLRGVVGDGLDPAIVAEFTASYASGLESGPVVVGHDGRVSAPVFLPAVLSAVTACGRDALLAGPVATPTLGRLVRDLGAAGGIQISASHNPPQYNGLKFFQPGGMVLGPAAGAGHARPSRSRSPGLGELGSAGSRPHPRRSRRPAPGARPVDRRRRADSESEVRRRARRLPRIGRSAGRVVAPCPGLRVDRPGGNPRRPVRPSARAHPTNLERFSRLVPALGAAVGFAQDPDADRLAIVDELGRYIGEELTLALAPRTD